MQALAGLSFGQLPCNRQSNREDLQSGNRTICPKHPPYASLRSRVPPLTLDGSKVSMSSGESDSVKTTAELFSASFEGDYEDEQPWNAVGVLRRRNSDEVFHLAAAYCRSE